MSAPAHIPVMVEEVIALLSPRAGGIYLDGTFGAGGYARALLDAADCRVWGIDRDPAAIERGRGMARAYGGRLFLLQGRFGDMTSLLQTHALDAVDGIALDLGVSSPQIDEVERGFSFQADGPLDMRMERTGPTAADLVNALPERELADIIGRLGEERHARRVAGAIVAARAKAPITRTLQLADIVRCVVPKSKDGIDPATRTFQGLRMRVNDELGELGRGLSGAEQVLRPGGRLAVVAFHSLEDRMVKDFFRRRSGRAPAASRHLPPEAAGRAPTFQLLTARAQRPGAAEIDRNPRARSARLRAAERTAAPAWPAGDEAQEAA